MEQPSNRLITAILRCSRRQMCVHTCIREHLPSSQGEFSLALVQQSQVCTRAIWSRSTSLVMTWITCFDRTLNKVDITKRVEQGYVHHLFSSSLCRILLQWERGTSANKCIFYRAPNKFDVTRKYAILYMVTDSSSCFFT